MGVLQAGGDLPLVHLQLEGVDLVDVTRDSAGRRDVGPQARDGDPPCDTLPGLWGPLGACGAQGELRRDIKENKEETLRRTKREH